MTVTTCQPGPSLAPFIKRYLIIECADDSLNRVFPDTSLVMTFRYKGKVSYQTGNTKNDLSPFMISGVRRSGRLINYASGTGNIIVLFRETGAHAFIREPLHELAEHSVPLDNCAGYRDISIMREQLAGVETNTERIKLVEQFLLSRQYQARHDALITTAIQKIRHATGNIKIKSLTDTLCVSQDAFEKRFRKIVGIAPKQFANIIRMKSVVNNGLKTKIFAEAAYNAGFFDQSHFNKDFKLFTGLTPTEFLQSPAFW